MSSLEWLRFTNWLILVSAAVQAVTGITQLFVIPRFVAYIHMFNAPLFVTLVIIHITYNWGWMKKQMFAVRRANRITPRATVKRVI